MVPIVGGRKVTNLKTNIEALSLELSPEDIAEIETGYAFDLGFPQSFINMGGKPPTGPQDATALKHLGYFDYVQGPLTIKPYKGQLDTQWKP